MKKSVIITDSETMFASMSKKEVQSIYFDNLNCINSEFQTDESFLILYDHVGNEIVDTMLKKASIKNFSDAWIILSYNDWINYVWIGKNISNDDLKKVINIESIIITNDPERYIIDYCENEYLNK